MEQYRNKFLVVTFDDNSNPPENFVEPVPWQWVKDGFVYYPKGLKNSRQKSIINSIPDYNDLKSWEKCRLTNVKGKFYSDVTSNKFMHLQMIYYL